MDPLTSNTQIRIIIPSIDQEVRPYITLGLEQLVFPQIQGFAIVFLHDTGPMQLTLPRGSRFCIKQDQRLKTIWMRMRCKLACKPARSMVLTG